MQGDIDILSVDESPVNLWLLPAKGWSVKGDSHNFSGESPKDGGITLLLAISFKYGIISWIFAEGGVNAGEYFYFLFHAYKIYKSLYMDDLMIL